MKKLYLKIGEIVHLNGKMFRVKSFGRHLLQLATAEEDMVLEHFERAKDESRKSE